MVLPPYEECLKLIAIAAHDWDQFDGRCAQAGLDPFGLPFRRFLNLIHFTAMEALAYDDVEKAKYLNYLESPLPGRERKVSQDTIDEEMAQFMAATGAQPMGLVGPVKQIEG